MGAAKSLAMTYSDREYLLYFIDRKDQPNIEKLIAKRPDLLNGKLTENTKMTPLFRSCYNGDLATTTFLIEKCKADVNQSTEAGETPLVAGVKQILAPRGPRSVPPSAAPDHSEEETCPG